MNKQEKIKLLIEKLEDQATAPKELFAKFAKLFGKSWQKKLQGALCAVFHSGVYNNLYLEKDVGRYDNNLYFEKYFHLITIGNVDYLLLKSLEKHKDFFKQTLEEGHKMREETIEQSLKTFISKNKLLF